MFDRNARRRRADEAFRDALVSAAGRVETEAYNNGSWVSPSQGDPAVFGFWLRRSPTIGREAFLLRRDGWGHWRPSIVLLGKEGEGAWNALDRFLHGSWRLFTDDEPGDIVVRAGGAVLFPHPRPKNGQPFSLVFPAPVRDDDPFTSALLRAAGSEEFLRAAEEGRPLLLERPGRKESAHEALEMEILLERVDPGGVLIRAFEERTGNGLCSVVLWRRAGCVVAIGHVPSWIDGSPQVCPASAACAALPA